MRIFNYANLKDCRWDSEILELATFYTRANM